MSAFDTLVESYTSTTGVYWALEDNSGTTAAVDSSGNSHTLTCSSFTFGSTGIVPSDALTCATLTVSSNGTSTYQPSFATPNVTLGLIVNFATVPTGTQILLNSILSNKGAAFVITSSGGQDFQMYNGTTVTQLFGAALTANHTYLMIGTWDGTTVTYYQYDLTASSHITPLTGTLAGATWAAGENFVVGNSQTVAELGRVFVLPVTLNQTQVTALYTAATTTGFTVTFNNNGGTGSLTAETDSSPTALSLFSTGTMAKVGRQFTGWNTAANGTGTAYADGASYAFSASATLYAQWGRNTVASKMEWLAVLNSLAGKTNLGELAAANAWAGTTNLGLLAALNVKAGTTNLGLDAACNIIAGTTGLSALDALNQENMS